MTFQEQMTTDLDVFFNTSEFAETVTYTPSGGSGSSISAIVKYEENLDYEGNSQAAVAFLTIKNDDVPTPGYRDTVLIGTDTWYVMNTVKGDAYTWTLRLSRDERPVWG